MSNATIESPVAPSQLFFAWTEQSEAGSGIERPVPNRPVPDSRLVTNRPVPDSRPLSDSRPVPATDSTIPRNLNFASDGRIAGPVLIGSVMIKLLKRYGITDAEIAEGAANYAHKHQSAMAS